MLMLQWGIPAATCVQLCFPCCLVPCVFLPHLFLPFPVLLPAGCASLSVRLSLDESKGVANRVESRIYTKLGQFKDRRMLITIVFCMLVRIFPWS